MPGQDPLARLRDIHLLGDPSWWPPAIGWWFVVALALLALLVAMYAKVRRRRRARRAALVELEAIYSRYQLGEASRADRLRVYLRALNALLRRVALASRPREQVASLSGAAWLEFLDGIGGGEIFRQGPGAVLGAMVYSSQCPETDVDRLQTAARRVLRAAWRDASASGSTQFEFVARV